MNNTIIIWDLISHVLYNRLKFRKLICCNAVEKILNNQNFFLKVRDIIACC